MKKHPKISINLYTTFYIDPNEERQQEYILAINKNLANPCIKKVYFFIDNNTQLAIQNEKIVLKHILNRPTFQELIGCINVNTELNDYNIIANTDIYFDNSIQLINMVNMENKVICLTRWDLLGNGMLQFFNKYYSTDTWIFKGKIKEINAKYYLGQLGCDNRFNFDLSNVGYNLCNPSYSIRSYHVHQSSIRSYKIDTSDSNRVSPPYLFSLPNFLSFQMLLQSFFYIGLVDTFNLIRLYREIRYEYFKKFIFKKLEENGRVQKQYNKFVAIFFCIIYRQIFQPKVNRIEFSKNEYPKA